MGLIEQVTALNLTDEDFDRLEIPTLLDYGVLVHVLTDPDEKWYFIDEERQKEWLELILKKANAQ